jgi:SanA protein
LAVLCAGILLPIVMIVGSAVAIDVSSSGRLYNSVDSIPKRKVGLVLGCGIRLHGGRVNLYFKRRISAAATLYKGGKVEYLLVSGDNHVKGYDEPSDMKASLIELGVPEDAIYCDYAGFRTFDSVVRAKQVFGQDEITVISQEFHNKRAIFIGNAKGIDAIGFNARDINSVHGIRTKVREILAKVKTVLDIYILRMKPKFLGEPVIIGE